MCSDCQNDCKCCKNSGTIKGMVRVEGMDLEYQVMKYAVHAENTSGTGPEAREEEVTGVRGRKGTTGGERGSGSYLSARGHKRYVR